jgi:peptidyl-tRNA hydrolase, PTH1 family
MEQWHLMVGLGNPGADYARTRHNAGFLVIEELAGRWKAGWRASKKLLSRLARLERGKRRVLLCQPQTFMNESGAAVRSVSDYYQVPVSRLVVVVDDADLAVGEIRLRPRGSSGGHHGLESIEKHLASREYARLRVGIGRRDGAREITGHVLGKFNATELALMDKVLMVAADQLECWLDAGIQKAMNQFNGIAVDSEAEGQKQ